MALGRWNPQTGRWEDEAGNPSGPVTPISQLPQNPVLGNPLEVARDGLLAMGQAVGGPIDEALGTGAPAAPAPAPTSPPVATQPEPVAPMTPPPSAPPATPGQLHRDSQTSTWGRTKTIVSQEERDAQTAVEGKLGEQANNARAQGNAAAALEENEGKGAAERARVLGAHQDAVKTVGDTYRAELTKLAEKEEALAKKPFTHLIHDASTAKRIGYAIAIIGGSIGAQLQGKGGNAALEVIMKTVDDDFTRQKVELDKQMSQLARKGVMNRHQYQDGIMELGLKKAAALDQVAEMTRAAGSKQASEAARLKFEGIAKQIEATALAGRKQMAETLRQTVTSGGSSTSVSMDPALGRGAAAGRVTESQGKAESFLTTMLNDHRTIEATPPLSEQGRKLLRTQMVLNSLYEKNPTADLATQLAGINQTVQQKLSDQDRRAFYAASRFLDPIIRMRSGAVVAPSEAERYTRDFFPSLGDKAQDIADKRRARIATLEGIAAQTSNPNHYRQQITGASTGTAGANASISDQQAIEMAKARLKANPNDDVAKRVLQMHGVQ